MKKKEQYLMFNFPLTKSSQQRKTARHCRTPVSVLDATFGCYQLGMA